MSTVVMWIIVIVFLAVIGTYWEEEQKRRQKIKDLQQAKGDFLKSLTQGNIAELLANGSFSPPPAEVFESAEKLAGGPLEAELVWRETEKWRVLNFGGLISSALLKLGSLTLVYAPNGSITVESSKNPAKQYDYLAPSLPEPFTPKDFRLSRPSPDTATLNYKVASGFKVLNATTVWAKRGKNWVTITYQVEKG